MDSEDPNPGDKRPRSTSSPEVLSNKSSKVDQGEQHCSVFSLVKGDAEVTLEGKNYHTQGEDPGTPVSSGKKVASPNRLDLFKECVEGNESPKDKIDCPYLYKLICGLEWRLHNLEQAHVQEISELKTQHAREIASVRLEMVQTQSTQELSNSADKDWIVNMQREIPLISQGLERVETGLEGVGERVNTLEQAVREEDVPRDGGSGLAAAGMEGGVGPDEGHQNLGSDIKRVDKEVKGIRDRAKKQRRRDHLVGDKRDQYSRRENLRVTGVPFHQGENTNQIMVGIACDLGVTITEADISVSHRSGKRVGDNPRPILCKFVRRDVKNQILANKMMARNIKRDPYDGRLVKIYVDEDLTSMRARVCKKLRQDRVPHYTRDGKVYIASADSESQFKVHDTPEDWESLEWLDSVKIDVGVYPQD